MPEEYPKDTEDFEEEEEEEEEEPEEEEEEAWTELVDLEELYDMEDGPSTYFVGGFSTCQKLSEPLASVQYQQDRVLIYPGVYGNGTRQPHETVEDEVTIDETRLRGLVIEGVPFARGTKCGYASPREERRQDAFAGTVKAASGIASAGSSRRVGPWFVHYAAAAQALAEQQGELFLTDEKKAAKVTMGSSVYQNILTCTELDPARFPVLASKLVFTTPTTAADDGERNAPALRVYEKQPDEEASEGDDEEAGADRVDDDDEDEDGGSATATGGAKQEMHVSVRVHGVCVVAGVDFLPLSRAVLRHSVIGVPTARHPQLTHAMISAVTAHPLAESLIERCVIFGGSRYGVYAYPRSQVRLRSCIVDGPSVSGSSRGVATQKRSDRHAGGLARLAFRARQRLAAQATGGAANGFPAQEIANFTIPDATCCDVGLYADDADVSAQDVLISNTKLGLVCRDACTGMTVAASDVRSVEQAGLYVCGSGGNVRIVQSTARACGREALLIVGPTEAEMEKLEAAYNAEHGVPASADEEADREEEEEEEANGVAVAHRPLFAAHPTVRHCCVIGAVRVQGTVRDAALFDNLVFQPAQEGPLSAKAMSASPQSAAQCLIAQPHGGVAGNWPTGRGFHYVGVEGTSVLPVTEA